MIIGRAGEDVAVSSGSIIVIAVHLPVLPATLAVAVAAAVAVVVVVVVVVLHGGIHDFHTLFVVVFGCGMFWIKPPQNVCLLESIFGLLVSRQYRISSLFLVPSFINVPKN
jgi:hypothetical protein